MSQIKSFINRSAVLAQTITQLQKIIQESPEGGLISRALKNGNYSYFRSVKKENEKKKEIYIPQNNFELAKQLALKEYARERLQDAIKEKKIIDDYISFHQSEKREALYLQKHPGAAELVIPLIRNKNEYVNHWAEAEYYKNQKYPEGLIVPTVIKDLKTRSKSEAFIVEHLVRYGVPLRYEEQLVIDGTIIHPDFTCLNPRTLEIFYWEHQGMWDDKMYVSHLNNREKLYRKAGIIPWINLLITTETADHPLDPTWIDAIIEQYLI